MNVLVMGSGAVGSYYGAILAKSGHAVNFVARGDHPCFVIGLLLHPHEVADPRE